MDASPAAAPRTVAQVVGEIRGERTRFVAMRVCFVMIALVHIALLAWFLPFVPFGMQELDTRPVAELLLFGAAYASMAAFLLYWVPWFRNESLSEFMRVLFGARQLIRGRQQFMSRLQAECRHATRDRRYVFSMIVINHPSSKIGTHQWGGHIEDAVAAVVRSIVRAEDIVGVPSDTDVWVLTCKADHHVRELITARLERELQTSDVPFSPSRFRVSGSTYGVDGSDPTALIESANSRLPQLAPVEEPGPLDPPSLRAA